MTYGWSILIIAIVLVALFELGIFNTTSLGPKLPPGSCQVFRPGGPESISSINLEGTCNNELPQTVSTFVGVGNYINVNKEFFQGNSFTILGWIYWPPGTNLASPPSGSGDLGYAWSGQPPGALDQGFGIFSRSGKWYLNFWADDIGCTQGPTAGTWYQLGASWNSITKEQIVWVNGSTMCSRTTTGILTTNSILVLGSGIGTWDGSAYMGGDIANIQIYNTSLSANQIKALYNEGIGGVPIKLQNLVGWWPLNGNANDYSGNNYNGQQNGGTYTTDWQNGYIAP